LYVCFNEGAAGALGRWLGVPMAGTGKRDGCGGGRGDGRRLVKYVGVAVRRRRAKRTLSIYRRVGGSEAWSHFRSRA
jgi:hypothetical protein